MITLSAASWLLTITLVTAELNAVSEPPSVGQQLVYSGKLVPIAGQRADTSAWEFRIRYLVTEGAGGEGYRLAWLVEEISGEPRLPWQWRLGTMSLSGELAPATGTEAPAIKGNPDGLVPTISLRPPFYPQADQLKTRNQWEEGGRRFQVIGKEQVAQRRCWKVEFSTDLGVEGLLWVDEQEPVLVNYQQAVSLGQGVVYELTLELEDSTAVSARELVRHRQAHAVLMELRGPAGNRTTEDLTRTAVLPADALEKASDALARVRQSVETGPYLKLARQILQQTESEVQRERALQQLADRLRGTTIQNFSLPVLDGGKLALRDLKGKPAVLHFWEYYTDPLVAPYGETGYLDFLWRKRQKEGVQVVGVAVDARLQDRATRALARKQIQSFCRFMNVSYPVALDEESLLSTLGDPRRVGGKLPLYVVIAPDGNVAEYHVGLWIAKPDEGLKELDELLEKLRSRKQ